MRKVHLLIIIFVTGAKLSFATNYTWQGPATGGDYQVSTNWTPNRLTPFTAGDVIIFNTTTGMTVINIPDETVGGITVTGVYAVELEGNSGNTLAVNGAVTVASSGSLLVSTFLSLQLNTAFTLATGTLGILPGTGGTIFINSALTINGTGNLNVDVALGNTIVNATGSISNAGGTFACVTASAISFLNGSIYYHDRDGSTVPMATWSTGSTCYIRGVKSVAPAIFSGVDFSNFTWNCSGQTGNITLNLPAITTNINGSLTITSTGGARLLFASAPTGIIRANSYLQNGGYLVLQAGGGVNTLSVATAFSHTGGTIDGVGYSAAGQAVLDLKGSVTKSALWDCSSSSGLAEFTVQFSGASPQGVNINGGWTVTGNGRSHISITNKSTGGITVSGGALQVINKTGGMSANCSMAGAITGPAINYTSPGGGGLTLIYNANFFQTASAIEYPLTNGPTNLTINNSLGVNFPPAFNRNVPGTLTMVSGNLAIGSGNNLNLINTVINNQLVYSGGFLTTGTLTKAIPASGVPTDTSTTSSLYPFGSGNNNRALRIFFSSSTLTTGGSISVTHSPIANTTPISLVDNGVTLDKRTNTNWTISNSGITGTATATIIATGGNIGVVNNVSALRLTDALTSYGTPTFASGTPAVPVIGKSGLSLATELSKTLYFGGDAQNPLIIITFVWTGASGTDGDWTNPGNWTGGVGYPNASTVIANISNSMAPLKPIIKTGTSVSVYQLSVGSSMSLTMQPSSIINVFDDITDASGVFTLDPTSVFGYASSNNIQYVKNLPYGSLSMSGIAQKILPSTITITGAYLLSAFPNVDVTTNLNNFIYAGAGTQNVAPANYYKLTLTGNRGGGIVTLGIPPFNTTIDIADKFDVSGLINFNYPPALPPNGTTTNFSSPNPQTIPGFWYSIISNSGSGNRTWDGLGSTDPTHVIYARSDNRGSGVNTMIGSKINLYSSGANATYYIYTDYYDLEFSGNAQNATFNIVGRVTIAGKFYVSRTNYRQLFPSAVNFIFNGTGDQTIYGHKSDASTNTPAFKYQNIIVQGNNRNITLSPIDTIKIAGNFDVPRPNIPSGSGNFRYSPSYPGYKIIDFNPGKGFITSGSTVNFSIGTGNIPDLKAASGINKYHNLTVTGGTRILDTTGMTVAGNLVVSGDDVNAATLASPGLLKIGDATGVSTFNVLGDTIMVTGTGTAANGVLDLNTGTTGATTMNVSGSVFITGKGQMTSSGVANGNVIFKGALPHKFQNNTIYKNSYVNFQVGDGVIPNTKLTLLTPIELIGSGTTATTSAILKVLPTDTLDCATYNVRGDGVNVDFAKFNLQAGATLVTANTGGIEGAASDSTNGTITNNATITKTYDSSASYIFNASSTTNNLFPTTPATFTMANLTIGDSTNVATFNLNKPIAVSGALTLRRNGKFALGSSDVTLISTATNTARVAPVQTGAGVSYTVAGGRFNVERNYRGLRRAWCLITSPLTETGSVFDTWQNGGVYQPGRGTFVTGTVAGNVTNGLDNGPQLNSSLKVGSSVTVVDDTKATLLSSGAASAANKGYFLFVRGDRIAANYLTSNWNATTLSSRGKIQTGSQSFPASSTAGAFNLIGNPYASPVSFTNTIKTNLDNNTVYVWDPYLNATVGAYATIILDNTGIVTNIIPGSPGGLASVGQPLTFQSSQAFWVRTATNGAASLQFNEADKSAQFNVGTFREMRDLTKSFKTNLNLVEPNDSILLADGNFVQFDNQYSTEVNFDDLLKFGNLKETFGLLRDGKWLSVERRPEIAANDTLFFKLTKTEKRNYQFQFVPTNMAGVLTAYLEDSYTNTKTVVSLNSTSTFNFTINGDAASAVADRFKIVFSTSVAGPLPVIYKNIKAYQQGDNIAVDWTVENEINTSKYEVEKSTDGNNFTKVNTTMAKGTGNGIMYSFIDNKVLEGNNFYRIKNHYQDGSVDYSRVVVVKMGKTVSGISIYPNPVTGSSIGLAMTNMDQGMYQVRLINTIGQTIMTKRINHSTGNSMETLTPDSPLSPGIYQLEVTAPDKRINSTKVIVQ